MERWEGTSAEVAGEASETYHSTAARGEDSSQSGGGAAVATPPPLVGVPLTAAKKKRGRPRKYGSDGSASLPLSPMPISASAPATVPFSISAPVPVSGPVLKRSRGRPPGSLNKPKPHFNFSGEWVGCSVGPHLMPHVITVDAGEDVATKIISFSQQRPGAICILSANGAISSVTLRQLDSSGGTLTYEGRFEILSLSGSFMPTENGGTRSRTGGMSVSLASTDGRVVGGGVEGLLVAARPVQVMIGSFMPSNPQEQTTQKPKTESTTAATLAAAIPISGADMDEVYSTHGQHNSSQTPKPNLTPSSSFRDNWTSSHSLPDFNMEQKN